MSTAVFRSTRPLEPALESQRRGPNKAPAVRLRLVTPPDPMTPGESIIDYIEALPVVCAAIRNERNLTRREAARIIGIGDNTLWRFEHGHEIGTETLMTIAEWVGPVLADEWERLRHTRYENDIPTPDLIEEVELLLRHDIPLNVCKRLRFKPATLTKRLRRAGRNDLANRFDPNSQPTRSSRATVLSP